MKNPSLLYRALLILGLILVALVYLVPTLVTDLPQFWKDYLPAQRVRLGLDLQGGSHILLEVDARAPRYEFDVAVQSYREQADRDEALDRVIDRAPRPRTSLMSLPPRCRWTYCGSSKSSSFGQKRTVRSVW